ncbi:hypothetical protein [Halalkalibacillus halophilus]|uniref:hypothetical protein n=1 Tax=Halalkalibacillus halophilus TaxID=392827 RepID=UPI00040FF3FD|nr:hypothetical protein [Halalkalibacillus halophilus]
MSNYHEEDLENKLKEFPKKEMNTQKAQEIHQNLMHTANKMDKREQKVRKFRQVAIGLSSAAAVFLIGFIFFLNIGDDYNFEESHDQNITTEESQEESSDSQTESSDGDFSEDADEESESNDPAREDGAESSTTDDMGDQDTQTIVQEQANEVIQALAEEDFEVLAGFVHEQQGLLFSPYVNLSDDDLVFSAEEVRDFNVDDTVYEWGVEDGSGFPIELTPAEFIQEHIYQRDYHNADEITYNDFESRGTMENNLEEFFTEPEVIEFYVAGESDFEWNSLYVVFEESEDGSYRLVALVNDEWAT